MSRAYSTLVKRVMFLSFLAVLVCAAPALADSSLTWYVNDFVVLGTQGQGSGKVTGNFTIDTTSLALTGVDATATAGGVNYSLTYGQVYSWGGGVELEYGVSGTASTPGLLVEVALNGSWTNAQLSGPAPGEVLALNGGLMYVDVWLGTGSNSETDNLYNEVGSGTLTQTPQVPLPPSVYLLGTGLIALAWARRKKRLGQ